MSAERGPSGVGKGTATISRSSGEGLGVAKMPEFRPSAPQVTDRHVRSFNIKNTSEWQPVIARSPKATEAISPIRISTSKRMSRKDFDARFGRPFQIPKTETPSKFHQKSELRTRPFNKPFTITTKFLEKPKPRFDKQTLHVDKPDKVHFNQTVPLRTEAFPRKTEPILPREIQKLSLKQNHASIGQLEQKRDQQQAQKVVDAYIKAGIYPNKQEAQKRVYHILQEKSQKTNKTNQEILALPLPSLIPALPAEEKDFEEHVRKLVDQKGLEHAQRILRIQGKDMSVEKIFRIVFKLSQKTEPAAQKTVLVSQEEQTVQSEVLQAIQTKGQVIFEAKNKQKIHVDAPQHYVVDKKASLKREGLGEGIISFMFMTKSLFDSQWDYTITGKEIAEQLPETVPAPAKSRLAKLFNRNGDGSYTAWRQQLSKIQEKLSPFDILEHIRRFNKEFPPVDVSAVGAQVSKADIDRVLEGDSKAGN